MRLAYRLLVASLKITVNQEAYPELPLELQSLNFIASKYQKKKTKKKQY